MNKYTAQGKTVEEAVQIALEALDITKDQAKIDILDEGKKGFLGIGQRDATVSVEKLQTKETAIEATLAESFMMDTNNKQETPVQEENPIEKSEVKETQPTESLSEDNVEDIDSKQEDNAKDNDSKEEDNTEEADYSQEIVEEDTRDPEDVKRQDQQAIDDVRDYILTIVEALDQKGEDAYVDVEQEGDYIFYDIHSDHPGIIIGRHGKVLESIHTVAQIYLHNEAASKLYVEVDTENYRGRRENSLRYLARDSAEKAIERKQPMVLENLSNKERKVIHRILSHNDKIKTYSKGKGQDRFLVVEPVYDKLN